MTLWTSHPSPIGDLLLLSDGEALTGLFMAPWTADAAWRRADEAFAAAREQLDAYFAGERTDFDLPLAPSGTGFQLRVWAALRTIPYGETTSYGALAAQIGAPGAARAVGLANGRNPVSIVVPCHRVIGAGGALTGYGGGLERKRTLLDLERGSRYLFVNEANPAGASVSSRLAPTPASETV
ncbi:MAG TPA: methylated-DNA--[protein]-cysteine S-methyltransferase [Solirubrobacteraceae bacterium]|jgi:methylated-DNA-[protein]-cysteine S-methyltransferase